MRSVATRAGGGAGSAHGMAQAMNAGGILFEFPLMALGATGRLRREVIIRVLASDVGMAACAGVGFVNAGHEPMFIHEQRNLFAGRIGLGERLVGVAIEACVIRTLFCRLRRGE